MKKILLLSAMAVLMLSSVTVLNSCKKGAGDPFLSLRSRSSRLAGVWTLKTMDMTQTTSAGTATNKISGTTGTSVSASGNTTNYTVTKYSYTFDKDGTYKYETTYTYSIAGTPFVSTTTGNGNWNFLSGGGDLKNKEAIYMNELSTTSGGSTSTSTKSSNGSTWVLTTLKNKTLIAESEDITTQPNSSNTKTTFEFEGE